jgi:hypothetical protein
MCKDPLAFHESLADPITQLNKIALDLSLIMALTPGACEPKRLVFVKLLAQVMESCTLLAVVNLHMIDELNEPRADEIRDELLNHVKEIESQHGAIDFAELISNTPCA